MLAMEYLFRMILLSIFSVLHQVLGAQRDLIVTPRIENCGQSQLCFVNAGWIGKVGENLVPYSSTHDLPLDMTSDRRKVKVILRPMTQSETYISVEFWNYQDAPLSNAEYLSLTMREDHILSCNRNGTLYAPGASITKHGLLSGGFTHREGKCELFVSGFPKDITAMKISFHFGYRSSVDFLSEHSTALGDIKVDECYLKNELDTTSLEDVDPSVDAVQLSAFDTNITSCDHIGPNLQLYFQQSTRTRALPIYRIFCDEEGKYQVQLSKGSKPISSRKFLYFCGRLVSSMCDAPPPMVSHSDSSLVNFHKGSPTTPSKIDCDNGLDMIMEDSGKYSRYVFLEKSTRFVCLRKSRSEPAGWYLREKNGLIRQVEAVGCIGKKVACDMKHFNLDCAGAEDCFLPFSSKNTLDCGKYGKLRIQNEDGLISWPPFNKFVCNNAVWTPEIGNSKRISCGVFVEPKPAMKTKPLPTSTRVLIVVVFFCLSICAIVLWRFKNFVDSLSHFTLLPNALVQTAVLTKQQIKNNIPQPTINRKKQFLTGERKLDLPLVDKVSLKRPDENAVLLTSNLALVGAEYFSYRIVREFPSYSYYEQYKFIDTIVKSFGEHTDIEMYFDFMFETVKVTSDLVLWEQLLSGPRVLISSMLLTENKSLHKKVANVLRLLGNAFKRKRDTKDKKTLMEREKKELSYFYYYLHLYSGVAETTMLLYAMYETQKDVPVHLRKLVWTTLIRELGKFDEVLPLLEKEIAFPTKEDVTTWGTRKEHLIYALCAGKEQKKIETLIGSMIEQPCYTPNDILIAFTAAGQDFHENRPLCKSIFYQYQPGLRTKLGVTSPEYMKIFRILFQFVQLSSTNQSWFKDFIETQFPSEAEKAQLDIESATEYGEVYARLPKSMKSIEKILDDLEKAYEVDEKKMTWTAPQ